MSDFRRLTETVLASPQIGFADLAEAKQQGVTLIINNRPDGEEAGQLEGSAIEAAARDAGLDYLAIPIGQGGFAQPQVLAMADALDNADGQVLAYCRSGTRSTFLWALSQAGKGGDPDELAAAARTAGYDVTPVRAALDMLSAQANG